MKARFLTCAALATAVTLALSGNLYADESVDPENKPASGENGADAYHCYARVSVPPVYRIETVTTETRAETTRFSVTPPVFKKGTETVTLVPAYRTLEAVQPELVDRTETIEILPASTRWVRDSLDGVQPVTKGELADIAAAGIDVANVETGSCYVEHFFAATLEDIPTNVLVSEATEKLRVENAVLQEKQVDVVTKPAFTRLVEVPPSYKNGVEKVQTATATKRWESECGADQPVNRANGETLCLVDVPPQFEEVPTELINIPALITKVEKAAETETVNTQILVSDAKEIRDPIDALYDSIDRQRISKPARYDWIALGTKPAFGATPTGRTACFVETPAKIAEFTRKVVKTPGRFVAKSIPAKTRVFNIEELVTAAISTPYEEPAKSVVVERKIKVSDARLERRPVLCQVNTSEDIIARVQTALSNEGFKPGPIDGVMGPGTSRAISLFQQANQIASGGLTIETLEKLGVILQ